MAKSSSSQHSSLSEVSALCRPVKFFHAKLGIQFLYGPGFLHKGFVMLKQETAFPKMLPQSWKNSIVKNIVCCSIKVSLNGNYVI